MSTLPPVLDGLEMLKTFHDTTTAHYEDLNTAIPTPLRLDQSAQDETRFLQRLDPDDARLVLNPEIPDLGVMDADLHIHPDSRTVYNADLQEIIDRMQSGLPEMHVAMEDIQRVVELLRSVDALKSLARFVAHGQPPLTTHPTHATFSHAEEHYPSSAALRPIYLEHLHRRALLRHLHYPGLIKWESNLQCLSLALPAHFANLYSYGRVLLEFELASTPAFLNTDAYTAIQPAEDWHFEMFDFVQEARPMVREILEECARVAWEEVLEPDSTITDRFFPEGERRKRVNGIPVAGVASRNEVFEWNVRNCVGGLARRFMEKYNSLAPTKPLPSLLLSLLTLETNLEAALAEEHIEDKLINKQISLLDEKAILKHETAGLWDMESMLTWTVVENAEKYMFDVLKGIVGVGRQRRNLRLLKEWSGGRPWRFLFQLYDTSTPETAWLRGAIETFHSKLNNSIGPFNDQATPDQLEGAFSSFTRIGSHVFGVFPLDYTTKLPHTLPLIEPCTLCNKPYTPSSTPHSTIAQLHCKHTFHLSCLIAHWDKISLQTHRCPTCGSTPQLSALRVGLSNLATSPDYDFVYNLDNWRLHNGNSQDFSFCRLDIPARHFTAQDLLATKIDAAPLKWCAVQVQETGEEDDGVSLNGMVKGRVWVRDPVAREMAVEWRARNEVLWQARRVQARDDDGKFRWRIPGARWDGESEMAWMRRLRRARDGVRREGVRRAKRGVHGLWRT